MRQAKISRPETITAEQFRGMKRPSREKDFIESVFKKMGLKVIPEYKFIDKRKFRADWFIAPSILIEYDGLFSRKSRHTTPTGFTRDAEKMNLATIHGFHVLRYTAINYKNIADDLRELILILQR